MSTAVDFGDIEIIAEPDHVYPWEAVGRTLDAHVLEDQEFKVAVTKRIDGIDAQLSAILFASQTAATAALAGNRWSRAGTLLGALAVGVIIACGAVIARYVPWMFTR